MPWIAHINISNSLYFTQCIDAFTRKYLINRGPGCLRIESEQHYNSNIKRHTTLVLHLKSSISQESQRRWNQICMKSDLHRFSCKQPLDKVNSTCIIPSVTFSTEENTKTVSSNPFFISLWSLGTRAAACMVLQKENRVDQFNFLLWQNGGLQR